ncbi:MAG: hypothetical protein IV085_13940 [Thiobacillus sp.]|nr:hypothetical protein [Thiobacillus sp.]
MSRTTIAVMLSALVLPGAGQVYLKRYWRGGVFAAASLACMWVIMAEILRRASSVLAQIEAGAGAPDVAQIASLAALASQGAGTGRLPLVTLLLALCWIASVADAFRPSEPVSVQRG